MKSIVVKGSDGDVRVLNSQPFEYEQILHSRIAEIPRLLPLADVTDQEIEHITIGSEWPAGTGKADVILLGSDAILTIVETKLKRNPEARREVIAQILEYAAYLSEWSSSEIAALATSFLGTTRAAPEFHNKSFYEVVARLADTTGQSTEGFKISLEQNLRQGRIRLIVAVDEVGEQAQHIVTFVNAFSAFDMYLLEIRAYQDDDGRQIFVPALHGFARKVSSANHHTIWNWEMFQSELDWTTEEIDVARTLHDRLQRIAAEWNPNVRFERGWISFDVGDKRGPFGILKSKRLGVRVWFKTSGNLTPLPASVRVSRHNKGYTYLGGDLDKVDDSQFRNLCRQSIDPAGAE